MRFILFFEKKIMDSDMNNVGVGIIGVGEVGGSAANNILGNKDQYAKQYGTLLDLKGVSARNPNAKNSKELYESRPELFMGHNDLLSDEKIDLIIVA